MGVVGAIGGLIGGIAQVAGGVAKKRAAEAEKRYIRRVGKQEEREFRQQGEEFKGEQRAALGAAGAEMGTGSPLQLQQETAAKIESDALKIRREYKHRAKQAKRAGGAALTEGLLGMGSTLLTSLGGFKFKTGTRSTSTSSRYIPGAGWVQ